MYKQMETSSQMESIVQLWLYMLESMGFHLNQILQ